MTAITGEVGAVRYRQIIHPPLVELRVEEGDHGYLAIGTFRTARGPLELSALVPRVYVERARKLLAARLVASTSGHSIHVGAARAICGAAVKRKMRAIASDPKLGARLGIESRTAAASPRALAAYRAARALLAQSTTPAGRAGLQRIIARGTSGDPRAARALKVLAIVRKAA